MRSQNKIQQQNTYKKPPKIHQEVNNKGMYTDIILNNGEIGND